MADISSSTGYIWKKGSCDELFRAVPVSPQGGPVEDEARQLCDMVRDNRLPPLTLKAILDSRLSNLGLSSHGTRAIDTGKARLLLRETKAELVRELPELKAFYEPYQRRVFRMWLFVPALAGLFVCYFYAKSCTPVLFKILKRRCERALFGKSKYDDLWQSFIKPKRKL